MMRFASCVVFVHVEEFLCRNRWIEVHGELYVFCCVGVRGWFLVC